MKKADFYLGPKYTFRFSKKFYPEVLEIARQVIKPEMKNIKGIKEISALDTKKFEQYMKPMPKLLKFKSIWWNPVGGSKTSVSPQHTEFEIAYPEEIENEIGIYLIGKKEKYPPNVLNAAEEQTEKDYEYHQQGIPVEERPPRYWCKVKDMKLRK